MIGIIYIYTYTNFHCKLMFDAHIKYSSAYVRITWSACSTERVMVIHVHRESFIYKNFVELLSIFIVVARAH